MDQCVTGRYDSTTAGQISTCKTYRGINVLFTDRPHSSNVYDTFVVELGISSNIFSPNKVYMYTAKLLKGQK